MTDFTYSNKNPWSGRFSKDMAKNLIKFNTSLPSEEKLFEADIIGTQAHIKMLESVGIINADEYQIIDSALVEILADWKKGDIKLFPQLEDIHMNLESLLIERVGDIGKKTHSARSRNDQQATAQRIFFKQSTLDVIRNIDTLQKTMLIHCMQNPNFIMPSYTHLQRAEFTLYAHWLSSYIVMLERDFGRFIDVLVRANECPLGSCASTGTSLPIDRHYSAELLGFTGPTLHSIDSVSDRDYLMEFTSAASILMIHLSRFSEEIITFTSQEFDFIELADEYCTGSSIMPQKKNPDVLELVRGKSGTVIGNNMSLMVLLKSLPLGYNKDLQEDKTAWFSALDNCLSSLEILSDIVRTMQPKPEKMRDSTNRGHIMATEYANFLVRKGLPFRDAHKTIGNLVKIADQQGVDISQLPYSEFQKASNLFDESIKLQSVEDLVLSKNTFGACGSAYLEDIQRLLDIHEQRINSFTPR